MEPQKSEPPNEAVERSPLLLLHDMVLAILKGSPIKRSLDVKPSDDVTKMCARQWMSAGFEQSPVSIGGVIQGATILCVILLPGNAPSEHYLPTRLYRIVFL